MQFPMKLYFPVKWNVSLKVISNEIEFSCEVLFDSNECRAGQGRAGKGREWKGRTGQGKTRQENIYSLPQKINIRINTYKIQK